MSIEEDFHKKTLEAIENLDFDNDIPDDVLLSKLITDLQVRAYALGKIDSGDIPEVVDEDQPIEYWPKFDYSIVGGNNLLTDCYDCGATVNNDMIETHENFHIAMNKAIGSSVTGYIPEEESDDQS